MKKSVILTILVIYVLAIVIVGFVGMKMTVYNPVTYVQSISCTNEYYNEVETQEEKNNLGYDGYVFQPYTEGLKVELKFRINPENATDKDIEYLVPDNNDKYKITINKDAVIIEFTAPTTVMIVAKSTDNHGAKLRVNVTTL